MAYDTEKIRAANPLPEYLAKRGVALKKSGKEFVGLSPFASEKSPSFTVYTGKRGEWRFHCFSSGLTGDVIDFVCRLDGVTLPEACEILNGVKQPRRPTIEAAPPKEINNPYAGLTVRYPPADAPAILAGKRTPQLLNPKRAEPDDPRPMTAYTPEMVHPIIDAKDRLVGYVLRVKFDDKHKITPTILWCETADGGFMGWSHCPLPEPRQIYGLPEIVKRPELQWLIVEGEKCRDVGATVIDGMNLASWIGGGTAFASTKWDRAAGKNIVVWADNDEPGRGSMYGRWVRDEWRPGLIEILIDIGAASVKAIHVEPDEKPKGWDIADAIAEGMGKAELVAFMRARARVWTRETVLEHKAATKPQAERQERQAPTPALITTAQVDPAASEPPASKARVRKPTLAVSDGQRVSDYPITPDEREAAGLPDYICDNKGFPKPKLMANWLEALRYDVSLRGVFRWDEFSQGVWLQNRPPWHKKGEWTPRKFVEIDDENNTRGQLERIGMTPPGGEVHKAIHTVAHEHPINPVREYMAALEWDGVKRIAGEPHTPPWLAHYCGARDTLLTRAIGLRFMVGCVARVFEPGCKMDNMLILEGSQGIGKSSLFEALCSIAGGRYYTDTLHDIGSTDTTLKIVGALINEVSELAAFKSGSMDTIKGWLSSRIDRVRIPYARAHVEIRRQGVLVGTVNPSGTGYLRDPSGARRFWPVHVAYVLLDLVRRDRDQLWAEAVQLYRDGEQWHLTDEEVALAEIEQHGRMEIDPWLGQIDTYLVGRREADISEIMAHLLIPAAQQTTALSARIANVLRSEGWKPGPSVKRSLTSGKPVRIYIRPPISEPPMHGPERDDAP